MRTQLVHYDCTDWALRLRDQLLTAPVPTATLSEYTALIALDWCRTHYHDPTLLCSSYSPSLYSWLDWALRDRQSWRDELYAALPDTAYLGQLTEIRVSGTGLILKYYGGSHAKPDSDDRGYTRS